MIKILIVSDLHIFNNKNINNIKSNEDIQEVINTFNLIENNSNDVDIILFLGDIFDTPDKSTTEMNSLIVELFRRLSVLKPITIITGNHDCVSTNVLETNDIKYTNNQLNILRNIPNINIIDKPKVFNEGNNQIIFIPYSNNIKESFNLLELRKKSNKICFGHFEVKGTNDYQELLENKDNMISIEDLNKLGISSCILGHIHNPGHYVFSNDENDIVTIVDYIGSSRNINFNNTSMTPEITKITIDEEGLSYDEHIINPYTCIYKTFEKINDLNNYIKTFTEECCLKTKVKYRYNTTEELKEISKIKNLFKSFKLEKKLNSITTENGVKINKEDVEDLGNLLNNSLIDNNTIIETCYKFLPPNNKEDCTEVFEIIREKK